MAPLAGKPPFATDEPDVFYESSRPAQPRRQRQPPKEPSRTSAYDVYDSYFGDDTTANRQSGMGAVGLGLMTGSLDDDEDDEDDRMARKTSPKKSKHDLLAQATRERTPSPPPQYIAQPKPGYAAPIDTLDKLAKPEPAATPNGRLQHAQNPNLQVNTQRPSPSPSVPNGTNNLQAPISPITPAFARPRPQRNPDVTFDDKTVIRGDAEGGLIPRRGERGDDFWRRFSMVARDNNSRNGSQKESLWLRKTQNGSRRLSAWVWIVGLVLLLVAAGGIGIGVYSSHKNTSHTPPTAFGGSEGEKATGSPSGTLAPVGQGSPSAHTSFHVSPTNTVARREPIFTAIAAHRRNLRYY